METKREQDEKLSTFLAVAGEMVEPEVAKAMLESADWNLESALNGLLEGGVPTESEGPGPVADSSSASMVQDKYTELSMADLRALLDAYEVDHSSCSDRGDLVKLLEQSVGGSVPSHTASAPVQTHPQFELPIAGYFGQQFSTDDGVVAEEPVPEKWEHRLSVLQKKFPWASRSQVLQSLKKHDGAACVVDDELQKIASKKAEQARINAERQAEIEMQNEEYRESLLMDQHRQAQIKEAEAMEEQQKELDRQQQEEKARLVCEAALEMESKRLRVSQPEPDKTHPDRCQIVIRTPSGKRLTRTFLGSDEVCYLYDWIDVSCADEEFVKSSYQVVSRVPGRPSKELCKSSRSLKQEGVEHQSVFFVTSCS